MERQLNIWRIVGVMDELGLNQGLGASRVDVRALAYGVVLGVTVITDDSNMTELGKAFGIEVKRLLDLLKLMYDANRIDIQEIRILLDYLQYNRALPCPSFRKDVMKASGSPFG